MEDFKLSIKDSSLSFVIGFIFCQLAVLLITTLLLFIISVLGLPIEQSESFLNGAWGYLISTLALDGTMLIIFFFFNKGKNNHIFHKPTLKKSLIYTLIAILSFLALYPIIYIINLGFIKLGITLPDPPYDFTKPPNYLISIISLVILPATMEELLFRGIISRGLKKHGKIFSIIITALMFSIFHMSISQTVYPFLIGIILTLVMYNENNIFYPILMHAVNNFLSLTLSFLSINLVFDHWTYIVLAIILAIIFLSIVIYFTIIGNKSSKQAKFTPKEILYLSASLVFMIVIWMAYNIANILL